MALRLLFVAFLLAGCTREPPAPTIFHVLNREFISRGDFAEYLRKRSGEPIRDAEISQKYAAFLDDLDALQRDQCDAIRKLVRETGVRAVFLEGVTDQTAAAKSAELKAKIPADSDTDREQLLQLG